MTKGCYTCRRRRIICDNGQPTCRKCRDAGKECLGYQKPLVWVKGGVASRGKMMGRSFDDVKKPDGGSKAQSSTGAKTTAATNTSGFGFFSIAESSSATSSPSSGTHESPESDTYVQESMGHAGLEIADEGIIYRSGSTEEPDNRVVHVPRAGSTDYISAPWGLVDPLFKDMSQMSRFYLFHCTLCKHILSNRLSFLLTTLCLDNQHMANDFVVYSQSRNPWRDIISLVGDSPLLAHGLCAMGALHYSLMSDSDSSQMPWSSNNLLATSSPLSPEDIETIVSPAGNRRPSSRAFQHFLEFKQRTLHQLSNDLSNPVMQKDDRTLAAIVVLALVDIFESGSGAWSYHIEGAKKLLRDRPENNLGRGILDGLESFAIDGCLM